MSTDLGSYLGRAGSLRRFAEIVVLVVGALAIVGGLAGVETLDSTTYYLGGAALAVLAVAAAWSFATEVRRPDDEGASGSPDSTDADRSSPPALHLYQAEGCPYCRRVREFCTKNGISVVLHNPRTKGTPLTRGRVTDRARYEELTGHGQDQVPLLVDERRGEALYESDDIVAYLREHYA